MVIAIARFLKLNHEKKHKNKTKHFESLRVLGYNARFKIINRYLNDQKT